MIMMKPPHRFKVIIAVTGSVAAIKIPELVKTLMVHY